MENISPNWRTGSPERLARCNEIKNQRHSITPIHPFPLLHPPCKYCRVSHATLSKDLTCDTASIIAQFLHWCCASCFFLSISRRMTSAAASSFRCCVSDIFLSRSSFFCRSPGLGLFRACMVMSALRFHNYLQRIAYCAIPALCAQPSSSFHRSSEHRLFELEWSYYERYRTRTLRS